MHDTEQSKQPLDEPEQKYSPPQSNPAPSTLDTTHLAHQIEEIYECHQPDNIESVHLIGSFANPEKSVDKILTSDVDLIFLLKDIDGPKPTPDPSITHPKATLKFKDEHYMERPIDGFHATTESIELGTSLEIPVEVETPPTHSQPGANQSKVDKIDRDQA